MKRTFRLNPALAASAVLLLALAAAAAAHLAAVNHVRRTLFFPRLTGRPPVQKVRYAGEDRRVPARSELEARIGGLVEEILLGPADPRNRALVGPGTRLLSVAAADATAYVNLSGELLGEGSIVPPQVQVQVLADTIYYNFPNVRRVHVLIDGQQPDFSRGAGDPAYDFRAGVPRSHLLRE